MPKRHSYIMRDQNFNQIGTLMGYDLTRRNRKSENFVHLLSVGVVFLVYLVSMALAG